jgi:hypothetical protein
MLKRTLRSPYGVRSSHFRFHTAAFRNPWNTSSLLLRLAASNRVGCDVQPGLDRHEPDTQLPAVFRVTREVTSRSVARRRCRAGSLGRTQLAAVRLMRVTVLLN